MYHEQTYKQTRRKRINRILIVLALIACAALAFVAITLAQAHAREQAAISLRESVLNAAKQCCAVEGSYPSSLEHLEQEYGLTINHDDYVVSYEWFADNVLPSVVVTAR